MGGQTKIISKTWFTNMNESIGIIVIQNKVGEKKAYMGTVAGIDEETDTGGIIDEGAPVTIDALKEVVQAMGYNIVQIKNFK